MWKTKSKSEKVVYKGINKYTNPKTCSKKCRYVMQIKTGTGLAILNGRC